MDQILLYQVHLQRINEKLETYQINEDINGDNLSLTED